MNTLQDISLALPRAGTPRHWIRTVGPIDVNFTVSFKRSGELFGKPRVVTFAHRVTNEIRERYYAAVAEAIDLCSRNAVHRTDGRRGRRNASFGSTLSIDATAKGRTHHGRQ